METPEGLHGQEGGGAGAGADRRVPRAARARIPSGSAPSAPRPGPIGSFSGDLRQGLEDGSLAAAKGVGPATLQIVTELVDTGRASMLEELREQIPPGLVEMLAISGLGVAKIRQIHDVLGIDSLPELEAAALDGRLAKLPRFGQKTSENILKGIAFLRQASAFRLSHHAAEEAEGLRAALERLPGVTARDRRGRRAAPLGGGARPGPRAGGRGVAGGAVPAAEPAARRARVRRPGRAAAHAPVRRRAPARRSW